MTEADVEHIRERFRNFEHWILVCDEPSRRAIEPILLYKYYAFPDDLETFRGDRFSVIVARKKRLLGFKLASIIRQLTPTKISEKDVISRDFVIIAEPPSMTGAAVFAGMLLDGKVVLIPV